MRHAIGIHNLDQQGEIFGPVCGAEEIAEDNLPEPTNAPFTPMSPTSVNCKRVRSNVRLDFSHPACGRPRKYTT